MASMDVVVSEKARDFAVAHGGVVYVRSHAHRCCSGPITLLDTTTDEPADAVDYVHVTAGDLTVHYRGDPEAGPHVLTVEIAGHPEAPARLLLGRLRLEA